MSAMPWIGGGCHCEPQREAGVRKSCSHSEPGAFSMRGNVSRKIETPKKDKKRDKHNYSKPGQQ